MRYRLRMAFRMFLFACLLNVGSTLATAQDSSSQQPGPEQPGPNNAKVNQRDENKKKETGTTSTAGAQDSSAQQSVPEQSAPDNTKVNQRDENKAEPTVSTPAGAQDSSAQQSVPEQSAPDNTKVNQRDKNKSEPTADQQKENRPDREITRQIRRSIVQDKSLSSYAHNVKIVSENGMVTLKGPVSSDEEKTAVEAKAAEIAGKDKVTSQLEVKPKK